MPGINGILEPGERVIARDPPRWLTWMGIGFFAAPAALLVGVAGPAEIWGKSSIFSVTLLAYLPITLWMFRWRLLVTDRRAIVRSGFLGTELNHMRLDEVREVRREPFRLRLLGRDRELNIQRIPMTPLSGAILRILDPAYEAAGPASGKSRLDGGLAPGETILKGSGKPWDIILHVAVFMGAMAVIVVNFSGNILLEEPSKLLSVAGLLVISGMTFGGMAWLAVASRRDRWLVTDRRIRVAHGLSRSWTGEMMLNAVETARFSGDCLGLRGGGQAMDISFARIPADVLHRVLPRQFPVAGARSARLDRLLQPGERLLMRHPGRWADWAAWIAIAAVGATIGAALLFVSYQGVPLTGRFAALLTIPVLGFLGALTTNRHSYGWTVAVTGRRLLRRFDQDPAHYEEIETHKIKSIRRLPEKRGLLIRLDDREFEIIAGTKATDRLLAALGRTAEAS